MLIGIISDTHDHVPHVEQAVEMFKQRQVDLVIHAGDYCSPFNIPPFEGLPLKGVFGNNDGDLQVLLAKFRKIDAEIGGDFLEVDLPGCFIAVYHGTHEGITNALRRCNQYDVVISGHTHETLDQKFGDTLAINPGTAHGFEDEATIAFLDTETLEPEFMEL